MTGALEANVHDFLARKRIALLGPGADIGHPCMRRLLKLTGGLPT